MEDKLKRIYYFLYRQQKQTPHSHASESVQESGARPRMSLKARMLGGQAKTIMRLGGSTR